MKLEEALEFIDFHGIVLESAKGPVSNLADTVAGERIKGSYWGHPKGNEIFMLTRAIRSSEGIIICRLIEGKVTYVHQRLWPAIFRLQDNFRIDNLGAIQEIHTESGKHRVRVTPFPDWVPLNAREEAEQMTVSEAASQLGEWFEASI